MKTKEQLQKQIKELKKDKNVWRGLCKIKMPRYKIPLKFNEIEMIQNILLGECMPTFSYREQLVKKLEKLWNLKKQIKEKEQ